MIVYSSGTLIYLLFRGTILYSAVEGRFPFGDEGQVNNNSWSDYYNLELNDKHSEGKNILH